MQTKVGVAIIGGGLMGREIASALSRWPALIDHPVLPELVAVADINPAALEWFKSVPTIKLLTEDYKQMLADPRVDVVYVAVRHDLHAQIYEDVIRAGKSLLAEKPFGIDAAAAEVIMKAISETPESFVRCSSEIPFFPGAQWAINYVQSGAVGQIIEAKSSFLHASDFDQTKAINWKRQNQYCGEAGVMNDLGLHALHVPLRLGWRPETVYSVLQNIVPMRPDGKGGTAVCDTWDNATLHLSIPQPDHDVTESHFPLTVEMKRIDPGQKNTWIFEVKGTEGGVRFSTKNPKQVEVFAVIDVPGIGREQSWQSIDAGSQSVWPTVTGGIFESGFSDSILQMWAAFLAEREEKLGEGFGPALPQEAAFTHEIYRAALQSHRDRQLVRVAEPVWVGGRV